MNITVDISNVVLKTDRLVLREWKESDLEDFFEYCSVDGVGQMAGWSPHENIEKSKAILDLFIKEKKTFCIEFEGKAIGSVGIETYNENEFPEYANLKGREIGFVLSKAYWGKGIMPEAVKAVIKYCFEDLGCDFLMCGHFVWNTQSKRVHKSADSTISKPLTTLQEWVRTNRRMRTCFSYRILKRKNNKQTKRHLSRFPTRDSATK